MNQLIEKLVWQKTELQEKNKKKKKELDIKDKLKRKRVIMSIAVNQQTRL